MSDKKKKVLLIEDDKFICRAYKDGLGRAGFAVSVATDGTEGMRKIKADKPDLILLDLIMPGKNGFEVLEEVKADQRFKRIPVIVLSNLGQDPDIQKCLELSASDYLVKADSSMKDVIERVKAQLARARRKE